MERDDSTDRTTKSRRSGNPDDKAGVREARQRFVKPTPLVTPEDKSSGANAITNHVWIGSRRSDNGIATWP